MGFPSDYGKNFRAPKVDIHQFAMVPKADIPRSSFRMQHQHKTTIGASLLVPIYVQEVLPGDSFNVTMRAFIRLSTPVFPIMDNFDLESFFFFVPNRLVWNHWYKFMGEQDNPGDSISFSIPQIVSPVNGFAQFSVYQYMGVPAAGQTAVGNTLSISALPLRAYNLIYNQWFRDENLQSSSQVGSGASYGYCAMDDGPDASSLYSLFKVGKRADYFTRSLPWTQKGNTAVTIPLGTSALVRTSVAENVTGAQTALKMRLATAGATIPQYAYLISGTGPPSVGAANTLAAAMNDYVYPTNLYADLSTATGATINALRLAFQTQKLLERDARGGTRYTEIVRSHFGVLSPDARLMRPEYLGGGKSPINVSPVPQTAATGASGTTSPLGTLSAVGTAVGSHGFRYSATEHGHIIGLVCARRDQTYQQGLRRMWKRLTRYDFYFRFLRCSESSPCSTMRFIVTVPLMMLILLGITSVGQSTGISRRIPPVTLIVLILLRWMLGILLRSLGLCRL